MAVEAFARVVKLASEECLSDPVGRPVIPNWNRVLAAVPACFDDLLMAVEKNNG